MFMAFDAAGERILGAAMAVAEETLEVFDYTRPFPDRATCVLVGGFLAGPAGIASAAAAVTSAGAQRVEAVTLATRVRDRWSKPNPVHRAGPSTRRLTRRRPSRPMANLSRRHRA